ncbi:MAG: 4-hydroxythreonine-4-phosphate dehydrogenase PdxA [Chromatiales bacterium]
MSLRSPLRIAVTAGEPAGIGPDLLVQLSRRSFEAELVAIADPELLAARARALRLPLKVEILAATGRAGVAGVLRVLPVQAAVPVVAGRLDARNAPSVLAMLDAACDGCLQGAFAAMVTAPVHKGVINDYGIDFTGHTEYLAQRCGVALPVMMLVAPDLRVALATTHLPLAEVCRQITRPRVESMLAVLDHDLRRRFGLTRPRIAVCALNPHAGEGGHLGREELEVLEPAIAAARERGIEVSGPWPADTAFTPSRRAATEVYLSMYHDQGLPVLKALGFGDSVNVTLGLPIMRTSVDHGTALELAGSGRADPSSMIAAVQMAIEMVRHSQRAAGTNVNAGSVHG